MLPPKIIPNKVCLWLAVRRQSARTFRFLIWSEQGSDSTTSSAGQTQTKQAQTGHGASNWFVCERCVDAAYKFLVRVDTLIDFWGGRKKNVAAVGFGIYLRQKYNYYFFTQILTVCCLI